MTTHSLQPRGFIGDVPVRRLRLTSWPGGLLVVAALLALLAVSRADSVPAADAGGAGALSFVPNVGQTDDRARFAAHTNGASFYFTQQEAVLAFERGDTGVALRLGFVGANRAPAVEGAQAREGTVNYLVGSDAASWQTGVPTYGEVVYRELWPGIDMVFRGANGALKYEFLVAPGADPSRIGLAYRGAKSLAVSAAGQLLIGTPWGTLRDEKPRSFQVVDGRRVPVSSRFALDGKSYGFALGAYDASRPLVIDPGLLYSTYLGGAGEEEARNVAMGADGSMYVTGFTGSSDFPSTAGAFDPTRNGPADGFVTKLAADGTLVYSTFLGGSGHDSSNSISVDGAGNAYLTGSTGSTDFPTTAGAYQTSASGVQGDAFVAKLAPTGSTLTYSTYLGGSGGDGAIDIAFDATGSAYVIGLTSAGFPVTEGAFDESLNGIQDGFVAKLTPNGSTLAYATFLGGTACDLEEPVAIDVDATGNAYVTGYTSSTDFPTTPGAFDTTPDTNPCDFAMDGFVTKLNPGGSGLVYSTYLNGATGMSDIAFGIAVDDEGNAHVAGSTQSHDFPITPGAFDTTHDASGDTFVTKLNAAGNALLYSSFLGGDGGEGAFAVELGDDGDVYVSGITDSTNFPTTSDAFDASYNGDDSGLGDQDAFLARLDLSTSELTYSTYFGGADDDFALFGLGVDDNGNAVVSGYTHSADLPTTANALDDTYAGSGDFPPPDGWLAKIATETPTDSDGDGIPDDQDIEPIRDRIAALIAAAPNSPAADKLEDALAKVDSAIAKLAVGQRQGALGELEGAVGDIQAAVRDRHLAATVGTDLMRDIAAFARIIATQAIDAAKARNGNAGKIAEAEAARAQGDTRATNNRFKEAVGKYKDAVAKAESA